MTSVHSAFLHPTVAPYMPYDATEYWHDKNDVSALYPSFEEIRIQPQGQTVFTSSKKQIQFKIAPKDIGLLAGQTLALQFRHLITNYPVVGANQPDYCILQDGATSLFKSITLSANGVTIESVKNYNLMHNALFYHTSSMDFAKSQGFMAGYYLDYLASQANMGGVPVDLNSASSGAPPVAAPLALVGGGALAANTTAPILQASNMVNAGVTSRGQGGYLYCMPLSLLSIARCSKFIPLELLGSLELTFELDDFRRSHYINNPTVGISFANCDLQLDNIYLTYRLVKPAADIANHLKAFALSEAGFAFALQGHDCIPKNFQLQRNIQVDARISKSKVKSIWVLSRDSTQTSNPAVRSLSSYLNDGLRSYKFTVNGSAINSNAFGEEIMAGTTANGAAPIHFMQFQKSLNQWNDHNGFGLVDAMNYTAPIVKNGVALPSRFVFGIDLETVDGCMSGMNLKAGNPDIFCNLEYFADPAPNTGREFDFMYSYDFVVVVSYGSLTVRD